MKLINNAVLVIWKCEPLQKIYPEDTVFEDSHLAKYDDGQSLSDSSTDSNYSESVAPSVPHTVVFKCIGATKDLQSQDALRKAKDRISMGWTVPVRMRPEPTNIVDSQAIVFECEIDGKWKKIGYVVSNILNEVHAAIDANLILSVHFKCIKFVTHWSQSAPGFYAGISVTKNGPWDNKVKLFRSTIS